MIILQVTGKSSGNLPSFSLGIETTCIVTKVATVKEALALPVGTIVGDLHGGLTFTDAIAAVLESRSTMWWQETQIPSGEIWTTILVNAKPNSTGAPPLRNFPKPLNTSPVVLKYQSHS